MFVDPSSPKQLDPLSDQRTERYRSLPTSRGPAAQDPRQENAKRRAAGRMDAPRRQSYRVKGR